MKTSYLATLVSCILLLSACKQTSDQIPLSKQINYGNFPINKLAQKPPMGWNSWDVFGTDVTEEEVKRMADYMAENLAEFGYEYIVIDLAWFAPNATAVGERYKEPNPHQLIDEFGRLIPDPVRFPSSEGGKGFKPLADYIHSKGLKFGIHVMRGIPKQAVEKDTPIKGTSFTAHDIVMYEKACPFYDGLFSVNMEMAGSQEYYNSLIELYDEWEVDFIKADDMTTHPIKYEEIKAFRFAIEQSKRGIVLSLSSGAAGLWDRSFLNHYADMFRISGDFWDDWAKLKPMFDKCRTFKGHTGPGSFADCDMLPLGIINIRGEHGDGERLTRFTKDEQYTVMTLWSIFRSPLMLGMDLTRLDSFTFDLITNKKMLEINQNSKNNDEILNRDDIIIWTASSMDESEQYLAIFNKGDNDVNYRLAIDDLLPKMGKAKEIRNIWTDQKVEDSSLLNLDIPAHGAKYLSFKF